MRSRGTFQNGFCRILMSYAGNVEGDEQCGHLVEGGEQSHLFEHFAPCNGKNKYKGKKGLL